MSDTAGLVLPPRSVLAHIGPQKTGTTAIQGSLDLARGRLLTLGIRYVGRDRGPMRSAIATVTGHGVPSEAKRALRRWSRLSAEVAAAADQRVVISNEFLCEADDEDCQRIVTDLGGDRVHVVVTLRPWAELLPSQWQQFVRNGLQTPYDKWLDVTLNKTRPAKTAALYWHRHDHPVLIDRWARVVGAERVTVIVSGASDRGSVLRGFEVLLGLEDGYLVPVSSASNRSLTLGEVELVRLLNVEFKNRGWSAGFHNPLMRHGVIEQLRTGHQPSRDEPRISTPQWALDAASEAGALAAGKIAASGVRVLGDLSSLAAMPSDPAVVRADAAPAPDARLSAEGALEAVVGAILGSHVTDAASPERPASAATTIRSVSSRDLVSVLAGRVRHRLRSSLKPGDR